MAEQKDIPPRFPYPPPPINQTFLRYPPPQTAPIYNYPPPNQYYGQYSVNYPMAGYGTNSVSATDYDKYNSYAQLANCTQSQFQSTSPGGYVASASTDKNINFPRTYYCPSNSMPVTYPTVSSKSDKTYLPASKEKEKCDRFIRDNQRSYERNHYYKRQQSRSRSTRRSRSRSRSSSRYRKSSRSTESYDSNSKSKREKTERDIILERYRKNYCATTEDVSCKLEELSKLSQDEIIEREKSIWTRTTPADLYYQREELNPKITRGTLKLFDVCQRFKYSLVERAERVNSLKPKYEPPQRKKPTRVCKHKCKIFL